MDTLKFVSTETIRKSRVNDTIRKQIDLVPIRTLQYNLEEVDILIPVEKYTEKTLSVPIEVVNLPSDLILKTFPGYVSISAMVAVTDYSKLNSDLFRVIVDYNDIDPQRTRKLKVNLVKSPGFIVNTKFTPKNVDFIIER
ncbi:MAG: hypothetical protein HC905_07035 [Bacteroidales bacterium]|nr:hypothetical protein [Bacteroidales bacterium]